MSHIGVKNASKKTVGLCPEFELSKDFEKNLKKSEFKHNDIRDEIVKIMENQNFKCFTEYELSTKINDTILNGRADIVCSNNSKLYIFEIKSSYIENGKSSDLYQAYIYGYIYQKNYNKQPVVILVYKRNYSDENDNIKINNELLLPNKYFYIIENSNNDWINMEEIFYNYTGKIYTVSSDCDICENKQCPIKTMIQKQYI